MRIEDSIFEFIKRATEVEGIHQIVLFGSKARGDAHRKSDIDIFIVLENSKDKNKIEEIAYQINKETESRIELTFSDLQFSGFDESFISDVYGEGIILFSKEPTVKLKDIELKPKTLFSFSLKNLNQSDKMKVKRALYGKETRSTYKDKEYISKTEGIVLKKGKVGRGAILVEKKKTKDIEEIFERFGAEYKKIDVWV